MIRTQLIEEKLREGRAAAKTVDSMFRRAVEHGANCPPFVSQAILQTVKDVFPLDQDDLQGKLELGKIKLLVVAADEPSGKKIQDCRKVTVILTLDSDDDAEIRFQRGVPDVRRARILRMCVEAREQQGLLTYEDLAFRLLNCGTRTIVRDVNALRKQGLVVPTRGQQQDIGPGQTHRVKAVELFLEGKEPQEIARRLYHSLGAIENYVTTFARIVLLTDRKHPVEEIAFIVKRSPALVEACQDLFRRHADRPPSRNRIAELLQRLKEPVSPANTAKKGGTVK